MRLLIKDSINPVALRKAKIVMYSECSRVKVYQKEQLDQGSALFAISAASLKTLLHFQSSR